MNIKKGEGIILRKTIYSDADMIFEIFSKEEGKISVLAKGIRKQNAKNRGNMQIFSHIEYEIFSLASSKNFWRIKNSSPLTPLPTLSFQEQSCLSLLSEISTQFLSDNHEQTEIYTLWVHFLRQKNFSHNSTLGFIIKFFSLLGFFPVFSHASDCETPFQNNEKIFWELEKGLFKNSENLTHYKTIPFPLLKVFHFCGNASFSDIEKISFSSQDKKEIWSLIWWFYRSHSNFLPRSQKIFEGEFL